jgi:hypothetical protein
VEDDQHFGLRLTASDGNTVILDDRGMLQTWQLQVCDNLDNDHPLKIIFYVPPGANLQNGKQFLLSFTREWFRAYEKGAASGGAIYTSTEDGGGTVQTSEPGVWTLEPGQYLLPDFMNTSGYHFHDNTMDGAGSHNHGIPSGTALLVYGGGSVEWEQSGFHDHVLHNVYAGSHAHSMYSVTHTHAVDMPDHTHDLSVSNHTHSLIFGIYEGIAPSDITIKLDGVDLTSSLGGAFNENKNDLILSNYVTTHGWHILEIGSSTLGRINASLFIQLFMYM